MNTYKIRKRVPKVLIEILNCREIYRAVRTQGEVDIFNTLFNECTAIVNSNLPIEVTTPIVLDKGLQQYRKGSTNIQLESLQLKDITALYLAYSKDRVTKIEYKNRTDFFTKLLPALFERYRLKIATLSATDMETLSKAILKLPNRKYTKYKILSIHELLKLTVSKEEKIQIDTANKMIKRIRSLALYGEATGLYNIPTKITTHKIAHQDKKAREPFTKEEILTLYIELTEKKRLLLDLVYYSGLRPSEIHKASISMVDEIMCFNLKDSKEQLKTHSSYRYVPVHSKLLPYIAQIQELTYSTIKHRSRSIHINGKTLYSARHSFVTNLINLGVPPERVSELVGHAHRTMTMGTYFAGYSIDQLKADVELL